MIASSPAPTTNRIDFDIEAQSADKALVEFARQAELSVLFPTEGINQVKTSRLQGRYGIEDALRILMHDTGLSAEFSAEGILTIKRSGKGERSAMNSESKRNWLVSLSSAVAAALTVSPVGAQEPPVIEEVMVTASREVSLLSKTPIAVSSIDSDSLREAGISNPTQLAAAVPNLSIDRGNGLQITIRGVTSTDQTEKGDPSAAFMQDGIYIARAQAQESSFFDLERVEILRGPQGTLYGRNTTAGVVNLISARPQREFGTSAAIAVGDYGTQQINAMINVPVNDSVAFRAAVNHDRRDTYLENNAGSPYDLEYKENTSVRLSGLFDLSEKASLTVIADHSWVGGSPTNGAVLSNFFQLPLMAPPATGRGVNPVYINSSSDQQRSLGYSEFVPGHPENAQPERDNTIWGIMADFSYALTDELSLAYLGSYRNFERDERIAAYGGANIFNNTIVGQNAFPQIFVGEYEQDSHELRLAFNGDRLQAQAGVYYFDEESDIKFFYLGRYFPSTSAGGVAVRNFPAQGTRDYYFGFPQGPTINKTLAFFAQTTYSLTDTLRLTTGIRQTEDEKSRKGTTAWKSNLSDPPNFTGTPSTLRPGVTLVDTLNDAAVEYSEVTWKVGLDYDLSDATLLYGLVSTGYKAGGFNDGCVAGTPNCAAPLTDFALFYDPEELTSYEVGFRTRFAGNTMQLNGNAFHYDYENLQLNQLRLLPSGATAGTTTNAGAAKIDGIELEATLVPNSSNRFDLSAAWLDARYSDFRPLLATAPDLDFAGEQLDRSPELVLSAGYTFTLHMNNGGDMEFGVSTRYSDEYQLYNGTLRAFFVQPSFTKSDVSVTYNAPGRTWYVQAFGKNLEDEITISSVALAAGVAGFAPGATTGVSGGAVQFADPRTFGVRAGFKF